MRRGLLILAVADVETTRIIDGCRPTTLFWGLAIEGEGYRRFETSEEMWGFLEQREEPLCIYTHSDFDLLQLLNDAQPLAIGDTRSGKILRARGPGKHQWRDSWALFPSTLAKILECAGIAKPSLDDLEERNVADTEGALIAFRQLEASFHEAFGIEALCGNVLTSASLAMKAAESVAGKVPVDLRCREAYRGGRTEAFRVGDCGAADCWDINSSYPASFLDLPEEDELLRMRVTVQTDGPAPLFLEQSDAERAKLLFPAGTFYTWCMKSSYERYLGHWPGITSVKVTDRVPLDMTWLNTVGRDLVDHAYTLRAQAKREGNSALAYACKIALNSVYGRLGMKALREVALLGDKVASGDDVTYYKIPQGFLSFRKVLVTPKANYPYAAAITCNARARLYDGLMRAEEPFYCDTDSVYLPAGQALDVAQGEGLGEWQREGEDKPLNVIGCKDYVYGDKVARKGGDRSYRWTLKTLAAGKNVRAIFRGRKSVYDKREVLAGGATLPLVVHD